MRVADLHHHAHRGMDHGPILSRSRRDIPQKYGVAYAGAIFADNPLRLLEGSREGESSNHE